MSEPFAALSAECRRAIDTIPSSGDRVFDAARLMFLHEWLRFALSTTDDAAREVHLRTTITAARIAHLIEGGRP